jgi:anthranilate phosphoribosyltransferase
LIGAARQRGARATTENRNLETRFCGKLCGSRNGRIGKYFMTDEIIAKVEAGRDLDRAEAEAVMEELLAGQLEDAKIVRLLLALRAKGETSEELVGFARAMRRRAEPVFAEGTRPSDEMLDTCGTGGDNSGTFNVSTAAAFVVAGAGVRVAKHGNRSVTTKSGSADVLEELGVAVEIPADEAGRAIAQIGIGFLFAPAAHRAVRHAMPARRHVGGRTVFNLLGPLTNPAGASAQVIGVFSAEVVAPMAQALAELGARHAFVVHGLDGLDEISLSAETELAEVANGTVKQYRVAPEDFGLVRAPRSALAAGDAKTSAAIIRAILDSDRGPRRDIVLANAAAALMAADRALNFREGVKIAARSIDSGAARGKLLALIAFRPR